MIIDLFIIGMILGIYVGSLFERLLHWLDNYETDDNEYWSG